MTYDASESGLQTGVPVEFYEFQNGVEYFRYTSADSDISFQQSVFAALPINRTAIEATSEKARSGLTVTVPGDSGIAQLFHPAPPNNVVVLTVYRKHRGAADLDSVVVWKGRVLNASWAGRSATLTCESVYTSIRRPGLRRLYQRPCPHVLYGAKCGVQSSSYSFNATVNLVNGTVIGLSSLAVGDGYLGGGFLEWDAGGGRTERRAIHQNIGVELTINFPIIGIAQGATVKLFPGCDHTISTCSAKFSNSDNYGGYTHIPQKNPFSGTSIF